MKKILFLATTLILFIGSTNGQGIEFLEVSWKEALAKAKSENKLLFVDAYTTWCGPCKAMDKSLDEYESAGASSSQKVKIVRLDVDANPKLASHYNVSSIPQTFVFDKGKVIGHHVGALDTAEIRSWVDSLVK